MAIPSRDTNILSFSPTDISVFMAGEFCGTILSLSYSVSRETMGLFALGNANALGFNKGKRGIAGSLVFNVFQNHPLLSSQWAEDMGIANIKEVGQLSGATRTGENGKTNSFQATGVDLSPELQGVHTLNTNPNFSGGTFLNTDPGVRESLQSAYGWVAKKQFRYADQLPPFDIVLTFVNDDGDAATMSIESVIIANEAGGFQLDDLTSETAFTFLARSISPMRAFSAKTGARSYTPAAVGGFNLAGTANNVRGGR